MREGLWELGTADFWKCCLGLFALTHEGERMTSWCTFSKHCDQKQKLALVCSC